MKKTLLFILTALIISSNIISAQTIDDFNFSGNLTSNGWTAHSGGGTNPIGTTGGLTFSGYPNSAVGNAALIGNAGGEDVNFTAGIGPYNTNGATVYFSFMIKVTESANKSGDYFIHIGNRTSTTSFSSFCARIFAKTTSSGVNFGVSNTSTAAYGSTNFTANTTYVLVVKYTINTGGEDKADLWVFPSSIPASESGAGAPELSSTTSGQDIVNAIALRQGTTSQPQTVIDGIRVAATWAALLPLAAPSAPVAISASNISSTGFTANWNVSTNTTNYFLDVSTNTSFSNFLTGYNNKDVGNVTSFDITSLSANTEYYYRVRASNSSGASANSNTISAVTVLAAPSAPAAISASNISSTGFTANWGVSTTATNYFLDVSTTADFSNFLSGYNNKDLGNVTSFNIGSLAANTQYYYRVRASNSSGTSSNSNTISVVTVLTAPAAPVAISASNITTTGFTANWNASPNATDYFVDVSTNADFSTFLTGYSNKEVANVTSVNIASLTANTIYYYRVRASNNGGTSLNSNTVSITTNLAAPNAPTATSASNITSSGFTANWNSSANAASYFLDVSTASDFSDTHPCYTNKDVGNVTSINIASLSPNTQYFYRLRASNNGGTSSNSNIISATTSLPTPNIPVATPASNINTAGFTANWNSSANATSYKIDVSTAYDFSTLIANYSNKDVGNVTSVNVSDLSSYTIYYYRVRASNAGSVSDYSNTIAVTTAGIPIPSAPIAKDVSNITATSFTANWSFSSGATSYSIDVATDEMFLNILANYKDKNVGLQTFETVSGLVPNLRYYYRVRASSGGGTSPNSNTITVITTMTGVYESSSAIPITYNLYQNYPNPFNPSTNIRYALPEESNVRISIIDILGRVVSSFDFDSQSAGYHSVRWDGDNYSGQPVTGGVYIYTIHAKSISGGKEFHKSAKLMLMK